MVKYLLTKEESSNNQFWQSSAENSILKLGSKPFSNRFVEWHPQIVSYQRLLQAQKHTCVGCSASCHCCKLWGAMRLPVSTETAVVNLPLTSVSNITSEALIYQLGAHLCAQRPLLPGITLYHAISYSKNQPSSLLKPVEPRKHCAEILKTNFIKMHSR